MERTVDILIEISIYSAVITAFILLFRAAFKKRISPKVQYAMWLLLVLRLMLPVTIGMYAVTWRRLTNRELSKGGKTV